jgi:hypothetical protein
MAKPMKISLRIILGLGVIILFFLSYCFYISSGRPNIKIDYAAEMLKLVKPVDDENLNAAHLYQKAVDVYVDPCLVLIREQSDSCDLWEYMDFDDMYFDENNASTITDESYLGEYEAAFSEAVRDKDWITELTENELDVLEEWIAANQQTIEFIRRGSERPYCWWKRNCPDGLFSIQLPEIQLMRKVKELLSWRIKLKAYEGDTEGAIEELPVLHRVGEHYRGPRMLYEQLVGISFQATAADCGLIILKNKEVEPSVLINLIREYEKLMLSTNPRIDYRVEQFFFDDFLQRCFTDNGRGGGHMIPSELKKFSQSFYGWWDFDGLSSLKASLVSTNRKNLKRISDEHYQRYENYTKMTPYQLVSNGIAIRFENEVYDWPKLKKERYRPFAELLCGLGSFNELAYKDKAEIEAFITVAGLQYYRKTQGQYPENLDKLVKARIIKELPMDPYSDKALIYRRTGDGFILYSVGENFVDDGGIAQKYDRWGDEDEEGDRVFWPIPAEISDE